MKFILWIFMVITTPLFSGDWGWDITDHVDKDKVETEDERLSTTLIKYYQREISPIQGSRCPFYPSCSHYTLQAIDQFGFKIGFIMGLERIYFRENKGLFNGSSFYDKIYKDGKRRFYDSIWANNIFKESKWYYYNYYFDIVSTEGE